MNKTGLLVAAFLSSALIIGCGEKSSTPSEFKESSTAQASKASQQPADSSFVALIECGQPALDPKTMQPNGKFGTKTNPFYCFKGRNNDTELQLVNGQSSGVFNPNDLFPGRVAIGEESQEGLKIALNPSFSLVAQLSNGGYAMRVRVIGIQTNTVYFEEMATEPFQVISVNN